MRLICQKYRTDCGVSSLAMIANCSYEQALKAIFPQRKKHTSYATTIEDLTNGLKRLKRKSIWKSPLLDNKKISLLKLKKNAILILSFGNADFHAVVWNARKKAIFDPLIGEPLSFDVARIKIPNQKYTQSVKGFYEKRIFAYLTLKK